MSELKEAQKRWQELCKTVQEQTTVLIVETETEKAKTIKKLLKDYNFFVQTMFPHYTFDKETGKHVDCADFQIDFANKCKADQNFKGVAEWPREHAKSVHIDIFIPMWLKAAKQLDGMVLGGKSYDDACTLLGDIQAELQFNKRYTHYFGLQYNSGNWEQGDFICIDNCYFMAIGRGQSPRGIRKGAKRPNYGAIDDIDDDELVESESRVEAVVNWILGGFMGALDLRSSRFLMAGNGIHPKSVLRHIVGDIDEGVAKRAGIYHSKVLATVDGTLTGLPTWWQKFKPEVLYARFALIGYYMAMKEYFHVSAIVGKVFKREWINWDKIPKLKELDAVVMYFDPSYKAKTSNDFKAVSVWGNKGIRLYKIKQYCKQGSITSAVKWMYDYYETLPEAVNLEIYMEDVFLQDMFFDDFEAEAIERGYYLPIVGDKRDKPDKFARVLANSADYERGLIIYNEAERNDADFQNGLSQLLAFQKGSRVHDDAPDADEGAIYKLKRVTRTSGFTPRLGKRINNHSF